MSCRSEFRPSYAVLWRELRGQVCSGELEFCNEALRLDGTCRDGKACTLEIPYRVIRGARVGRAARERIDGRAALLVELPDERTVLVTSPVGLGMIHEVVDRLDALVSGGLRV